MLAPQRVVSLQPSVSSTFERLGLLDRLVACTKYCQDVCPGLAKKSKLIVADSWSAKSAEILAARPDIVIASVPYQLEAVAEIMKAGIPFLGLAPHSLQDVYSDISRIANLMGVPERGAQVVAGMVSEVESVRERAEVAAQSRGRPRVYCEEWGKPLIHSQGWVAEMVEIAGGIFLGTPGATTDSVAVRKADPEVIVAAWCGAGDRVPLEKIIEQREWRQTSAARANRVYCIQDEFLNTPGPTIIQGLHALAAVLHPKVFPPVAGVRQIQG